VREGGKKGRREGGREGRKEGGREGGGDVRRSRSWAKDRRALSQFPPEENRLRAGGREEGGREGGREGKSGGKRRTCVDFSSPLAPLDKAGCMVKPRMEGEREGGRKDGREGGRNDGPGSASSSSRVFASETPLYSPFCL
jgi:hypothetical protein